MKIKIDFVTNSSSTCFVLQFDCYLKEKVVKEIISCKEVLERTIEKISDTNQLKVNEYSKEYWGEIEGIYIIDNDSDEREGEGSLTLELVNTESYNEKKDVLDKTILLNMTATSILLNEDPEDLYTNKITEILQEVLQSIDGNLEVFYHQFPKEVCGDGWDTGDPMGQYVTKSELFRKQTKIGKLIRKDGIWKMELKK
jgi:hypothetical protein